MAGGIRGSISASKEQSLSQVGRGLEGVLTAISVEQWEPPHHRPEAGVGWVGMGGAENQWGSCGDALVVPGSVDLSAKPRGVLLVGRSGESPVHGSEFSRWLWLMVLSVLAWGLLYSFHGSVSTAQECLLI